MKKGSHPKNNLENGITNYKGADKESTKDTVNVLDVDQNQNKFGFSRDLNAVSEADDLKGMAVPESQSDA